MSIGSNIKKLREQNKLSQSELGCIAGVTDKAVSTWESDLKTPRMGAIQKMSDYFNVSKSSIIDGDNAESHLTDKDMMVYLKDKFIEYGILQKGENFNEEQLNYYLKKLSAIVNAFRD